MPTCRTQLSRACHSQTQICPLPDGSGHKIDGAVSKAASGLQHEIYYRSRVVRELHALADSISPCAARIPTCQLKPRFKANRPQEVVHVSLSPIMPRKKGKVSFTLAHHPNPTTLSTEPWAIIPQLFRIYSLWAGLSMDKCTPSRCIHIVDVPEYILQVSLVCMGRRTISVD